MKHFFGSLLLAFLTTIANGQKPLDCPNPASQQTDRPDTISKYFFTHKTISITDIPDVTPTSNQSFKNKDLFLTWLTVKTDNIDDFIKRSISSSYYGKRKFKILDTTDCIIFSQQYIVIVIENKKRNELWFYSREASGEQDVFFAVVKRRRTVGEALNFISKGLKDK